METMRGLGATLMRNYSGINPGNSRLADTMLNNNEPMMGDDNVVVKRKKKRLLNPVGSVQDGVARNSGGSYE